MSAGSGAAGFMGQGRADARAESGGFPGRGDLADAGLPVPRRRLSEARRHRLEPARPGNPFSFFIRWTTGSVFSHAALVFHVRDHEDGYANNFIIEAGTSGVDLTNLRDYCSSPYYIVGIKRFSRDWFGDDVQRFVRGHLLDHIKDEYDYWRVITLARGMLRAFLFRVDARPFQSNDKHMRWARIRRGMQCQRVHLFRPRAVRLFPRHLQARAAESSRASPAGRRPHGAGAHRSAPGRAISSTAMLKDVLFSSELEAQLKLGRGRPVQSFRAARRFWNQMHATTPRDIEETTKLDWLYVIRDGLVHKVSTYEEVKSLAKGKIIIPYDETSV